MPGWIFRRGGWGGGGCYNGNVWHIVVAAGWVPLKLLPCVLGVCNIFVAFAPFHIAARFLLACVFKELVILMRYE